MYARADAAGALSVEEGGGVEIRYKPNDGRKYRARADNLTIVDPKVLPDETCGPAEAVVKARAGEQPEGAGGAAAPSGPARAQRKGSARRAPAAAPVPEGAVVVYADGACSGNPGPAGLGVVVIDGGRRIELSEYLGTGTNNIAELMAILRALEEVEPGRPIVIHTDSQYSIGVLQKGWKAKANVALVASLREALQSRRPPARLVYVPGHAGVLLNERADALAREAVRERKSRRAEYPGSS